MNFIVSLTTIVIAYLTKTVSSEEYKIIVTSDKDYYQLIDDTTHIWSPNKKKLIDKEYVIDNWGIHPKNLCLARCFAGDQSDGIKGIKGAGIKTMVKRFPDLFDCNNITYHDIINISRQKVQAGVNLKIFANIVEGADIIEKNWKLMYLDSAMLSYDQTKRINFQVESKESKINKVKLLKIINREGLNSFDIHAFVIALKSRITE